MTRRNPPAKWVLPAVIDPAERLCVTIQVPNDFQHRAAFWGAMQDLGSAAKWADDPLHKAREVAQVWREIINETIIGDCLMPIIFRDVDCDIIEFSLDGGETWEVLANFSDCFISRHPYAPSRNEITPTGDYPNLILTPYAGQTEPLLGTGVLNIYPVQGSADYGVITGYSFIWTLGGAQAFTMLYGQEIGLALHPAMRQFISGQKTSIGGYSGMPEITNMLEVNVSSATLRGIIVKAVAGQTYPLGEFRQADGTLLSGTDEIGRQFLRTVGAIPTDNTAKNGSIVVNTVDQTIDVKMGSGWVQFQQEGPTGPTGENGVPLPLPYPRGEVINLEEIFTLTCLADSHTLLPFTLENGYTIDLEAIPGNDVPYALSGWWCDEQPNQALTRPDVGWTAQGYMAFTTTFSYEGTNPYPDWPNMVALLCWTNALGNVQALPIGDLPVQVSGLHSTHKYAWIVPNHDTLIGNSGMVQIGMKITPTEFTPKPSYYQRRYADNPCSTAWVNSGSEDNGFTQSDYFVCADGKFKLQMHFFADSSYVFEQAVRMTNGGLTDIPDAVLASCWWKDLGGTTHSGELPTDKKCVEFLIVSDSDFAVNYEFTE